MKAKRTSEFGKRLILRNPQNTKRRSRMKNKRIFFKCIASKILRFEIPTKHNSRIIVSDIHVSEYEIIYVIEQRGKHSDKK
jgi:hypothetical protein